MTEVTITSGTLRQYSAGNQKKVVVDVTNIVNELFSVKPTDNCKTDMTVALEHVGKTVKRGALIFLISDFIDEHDFEKSLRVVARGCEVVAIRCLDKCEKKLPSVGYLNLRDSETGQSCVVDTRSLHGDSANTFFAARLGEQDKLFRRHRVDVLNVRISDDFVGDVVKFFRRRMMY